MEHQPVLGPYFLQHGTTSLHGGILSRPRIPRRDFNTYPVFWEKTFSLQGNITGKLKTETAW